MESGDPCDPSYSANFYTPTVPYLRRRVTITHLSLVAWAETKERDHGYVTLPELSEKVIAHWVESDARHLAYMVLKHLAGRDV